MSFRDIYLAVISNAEEVGSRQDFAESSRACMMLLRYQELLPSVRCLTVR